MSAAAGQQRPHPNRAHPVGPQAGSCCGCCTLILDGGSSHGMQPRRNPGRHGRRCRPLWAPQTARGAVQAFLLPGRCRCQLQVSIYAGLLQPRTRTPQGRRCHIHSAAAARMSKPLSGDAARQRLARRWRSTVRYAQLLTRCQHSKVTYQLAPNSMTMQLPRAVPVWRRSCRRC